MLEKNKDYVEMRVSSTDCAFTQNEPTSICIDGYVYTSYMNLPDPGEFYILISKEKFEKLQANVNINAELARQWEINYDLLLKKTGFDTVEELVNYIHDNGPNSQMNWETLKEIIDDAEEDYISERDKAEELQKENEQLKKKLEEKTAEAGDPLPDFRELLKRLYSTNDVGNLEWTLNHVCGGRGSVNGWIAVSSFWKQKYETLSKLVGFVTVEETRDYLTNEAECDTLHEAISKLKDQVKYTCDEWYSANSRNNSWKAAAECNSPKELIEKRETIEKEIQVYSRALQEWKEITGYPSPSAVKTALESGASWCHAYNEIKKANEKLADDVKSWKNVTGYSTPEDYMHARISGAFHTPSDYTAAWQKATGCDSPDDVKKRIEALNERIDESEADYNHLLCITGFESEGEIEDALDKCDHSTLRKALVDYEFDYEALLKLTGYKSEHDIRVMLNDSEQFVYENMRELINSLKRKVKFTDSNWQKATGCKYPSEARILLEKWKVLTKCETPEAAATWITSYESACERGNRLAQDIEAWQKATGCDRPEDVSTSSLFAKATQASWRYAYDEIKEANEKLADEVKSWKKATGCDTPEMAEGRIKHYYSRLGNAVQAASCAAKHLDNITF